DSRESYNRRGIACRGARALRDRTTRDFGAAATAATTTITRATGGGRRRGTTAVVPRRRRTGVAERDRHRRGRQIRDRPLAGGFQRLRRRREARGHVLQQVEPADRLGAVAGY